MLKMVGVFLGVVIAAVIVAALVGSRRWSSSLREYRTRLDEGRVAATPARVSFAQLDGLPAPVQRYFRAVLTEGQPMVTAVRVTHRGTFNMGQEADRWLPFTSDQRVVTNRPGFSWDGRVQMFPGVSVHVHDAYAAGEGILHAAVLGLVPVVKLRGAGDIAEGELMRFFAEAAWYPTALLPSQGVRWESIDAHSARATLSDGAIVLPMVFRFDDAGLIETVRTEARARAVGDAMIPTPWHGRFRDYQRRDGMLVPLDGEVAWELPAGEKPYWRGRIESIAYEYAP
jgi:hypothetical protein